MKANTAELVAGYRASGLTMEQFARREGIYLQADETPVRCNDPDEKRGGTTEGWLWVISRPSGR